MALNAIKTFSMKNLLLTLPILCTMLFSCTTSESSQQQTNNNEQLRECLDPYDSKIEINHSNVLTEIQSKAKWFKSDVEKKTNISYLPKSFNTFHDKFVSDSTFQKEHIYYKTYIGVKENCDTLIINNKENWKYSNWDFTTYFGKLNALTDTNAWSNYCYHNDDKVYVEFHLEETGITYRMGFEYIQNEWYLTLLYKNNC
jgi:hypothetical protein